MKYIVILEPTDSGYSAYVPDLPDCVAAAKTLDEAERLIGEAIAGHVELLKERGDRVPEPTSQSKLVEVA
jgi:predicted RNase H-like HicB family nuclease